MTFETVHVTRSGRELPVEVTLNCLEWGGRELFCAFARDITERTVVEQVLRESEERYRSLFDGVPIGPYRTTPEGRMLDANAALVEILGFPSREALFEFDVNALYLDPEVRHDWQRELAAWAPEVSLLHIEGRQVRYDPIGRSCRRGNHRVGD